MFHMSEKPNIQEIQIIYHATTRWPLSVYLESEGARRPSLLNALKLSPRLICLYLQKSFKAHKDFDAYLQSYQVGLLLSPLLWHLQVHSSCIQSYLCSSVGSLGNA